MDEWRRQHTDDLLARFGGELPPPWARFPTYTRSTIGWRMGGGEGWLMAFWSWLREDVPDDEQTRLAFLKRHRPAPLTWASSVYAVLYPNAPRYTSDKLGDLIELGVVGEDVACATWLAQSDVVEDAPWQGYEETPALSARYDCRYLGFWGRTVRDLREAGQLPSFDLDALISPWPEFAKAATTGTLDPNTIDFESGWSQLAFEIAALGYPPAPWAFEMDFDAFEPDFEMTADYRSAWFVWITESFDDRASVLRYIDSQPTMDTRWEKYFKGKLLQVYFDC